MGRADTNQVGIEFNICWWEGLKSPVDAFGSGAEPPSSEHSRKLSRRTIPARKASVPQLTWMRGHGRDEHADRGHPCDDVGLTLVENGRSKLGYERIVSCFRKHRPDFWRNRARNGRIWPTPTKLGRLRFSISPKLVPRSGVQAMSEQSRRICPAVSAAGREFIARFKYVRGFVAQNEPPEARSEGLQNLYDLKARGNLLTLVEARSAAMLADMFWIYLGFPRPGPDSGEIG